MKCNTLYEEQCCTFALTAKRQKILNASRIVVHERWRQPSYIPLHGCKSNNPILSNEPMYHDNYILGYLL